MKDKSLESEQSSEIHGVLNHGSFYKKQPVHDYSSNVKHSIIKTEPSQQLHPVVTV